MIVTRTCDLCGWNTGPRTMRTRRARWNNDACRHCGGQTEERLIRGKWQTIMVKPPTMELQGFHNPAVLTDPAA